MQQKLIYYKSDFKLFIRTEAGFSVPFRFEFYTDKPNRPFVAKYDGTNYIGCFLMEDGRLCVAVENAGFGFGKLMIKQTYFLNDADYPEKVCDRVIDPRPVLDLTNPDNPCEIVMGPEGDDDIEFTVELPPYYQAGLTPKEHEDLLRATENAVAAANNADSKAALAEEKAMLCAEQTATMVDKFGEISSELQVAYSETSAKLAEDYETTKSALDADYEARKAELSDDYTRTKAALHSDYENNKVAIANEYAEKLSALTEEYRQKQVALEAAYASDMKSLNDRMASIETQYAIDKDSWQKETTDFIEQCRVVFADNESKRQKAADDQRAAENAVFIAKEAERDAAIAAVTKMEQTVATHDVDVASLKSTVGNLVNTPVDDTEMPTLCGQPPILFGEGSPKESVVPSNWRQFDPETCDGYNWNGEPSAIGQQYIDVTATAGGRYIAIQTAGYELIWKNF